MAALKALLEEILIEIAEESGCEDGFVFDTYFDAIEHGYSHIGAIELVKSATSLLN